LKPQEPVHPDAIFEAISPDFRWPKVSAEPPRPGVFPDVLRVIGGKSKTVVLGISWTFDAIEAGTQLRESFFKVGVVFVIRHRL
jgi:hypothetical protein